MRASQTQHSKHLIKKLVSRLKMAKLGEKNFTHPPSAEHSLAWAAYPGAHSLTWEALVWRIFLPRPRSLLQLQDQLRFGFTLIY